MMKRINTLAKETSPIVRLSRAEFVAAALENKIGDISAEKWIQHVQQKSNRLQILSTSFQALALIHAPVSAKLFNFDCHDIGDRSFLRADYSLECGGIEHNTFSVFVIFFFLIGFTFALPLTLAFIIIRNWKILRTPKIFQTYGFLYDSYRDGAEYWDIHELMRRLILTGLIIFLPPTIRLAACLLVSIIACCSLFGFTPHTSKAIQRLEQSSYVILTFKYVGGVLLRVDLNESDAELLGIIFILLDVVYICHSVICVGSIGYDVWKASGKQITEGEVVIRPSVVVPISSGTTIPNRRLLSQTKGKSVRTRKVEEIEKNHEVHRNNRKKKLEKRQTERRNSVNARLAARKKAKQTNALQKCVIFENLDDASVSTIIDLMEYQVISKTGTEICKQGEFADVLYLIITGTCKVIRNGGKDCCVD